MKREENKENSNENSAKKSDQPSEIVEPEVPKTRLMRCDICDERIKESDAAKHYSESHGMKNVSKIAMHKYKLLKNFNCNICGKTYHNQQIFKRHTENCPPKPKRKCKVCEERFFLKAELQRHLKEMHDIVEKNFKCQSCDKSFEGRSYLAMHIRNVHKGIREFKCKLCPAEYTNSTTLRYHVDAQHYGKRSKCDQCGAVLMDPSRLAAHIKTSA